MVYTQAAEEAKLGLTDDELLSELNEYIVQQPKIKDDKGEEDEILERLRALEIPDDPIEKIPVKNN